MSDFSSNLRRLRKRAGLSQDALAEKLSVARQTVWNRICFVSSVGRAPAF